MLLRIFIIFLKFVLATTTCSPGELSDSMYDNDVLRSGQAIVSSDGLKMLLLGADGSLKLFDQQVEYWSAVISNRPNNRYLILQGDGNLVLYDSCFTGHCLAWSTGTSLGSSANPSGTNPYHLFLQNDKNLLLIDASGRVMWQSGTSDSSTVSVRWVCEPCSAGTYSSAFGNLCSQCDGGKFSGNSNF